MGYADKIHELLHISGEEQSRIKEKSGQPLHEEKVF